MIILHSCVRSRARSHLFRLSFARDSWFILPARSLGASPSPFPSGRRAPCPGPCHASADPQDLALELGALFSLSQLCSRARGLLFSSLVARSSSFIRRPASPPNHLSLLWPQEGPRIAPRHFLRAPSCKSQGMRATCLLEVCASDGARTSQIEWSLS